MSRCVECDLAEPESLASLGGSAPGVVDGILSTGNGEPPWSNDPDERFAFNPNFDEFGITPKGQYKLSVF